jgi:hypothetical protein
VNNRPSSDAGVIPFAAGPLLVSKADYVEQHLENEEFHAVAGARVLFANYALIVHDFPRFAGRPPSDIDDWLIRHAAVISRAQAGQTVTNTPIRLSSRHVPGYRPPVYGRAAVIDTGDGCLIDVKGIGVKSGAVPSHAPHSSGILAMSLGLSEVLFEWLATVALIRAGGACGVVPSYGLIDLGFEAIEENGDRQPACTLVRRAHTRPSILWGEDDAGPAVARILRDVAFVLRRSGIDITAKRYLVEEKEGALTVLIYGKTFRFEGSEAARVASLVNYRGGRLVVAPLNLQYTSGICDVPPRPQLIDFGGARACDEFVDPLYIPTTASYPVMIGDVTLPSDPLFVHAASAPHVPWSANGLGGDLTRAYVHGECSGREIRRCLWQFVDDTLGVPQA